MSGYQRMRLAMYWAAKCQVGVRCRLCRAQRRYFRERAR